LRGEPFVEGDVEVEELFLFSAFVGDSVDHLDEELSAFERRVVERVDVVEEIAGEGAVGLDRGGGEAEVVVVLGDLLVDRLVVEVNGRDGQRQRHLAALGAFGREEAALYVVVGGGGDFVVVDGDELNAGVVERDGCVAVVGEDDAYGKESVLDVGQAEEVAVFRVVAGFGGDGDVLVGVGVEGDVLVCGFGWRSLAGFVGGAGVDCEEAG